MKLMDNRNALNIFKTIADAEVFEQFATNGRIFKIAY